GEGTFSWIIGFDGNFQSAVMEIYRGDDNVIEALEDTVDLIIDGELQDNDTGFADLTAGEYLVVFVLSNGTDTVEIWETLHVYQNMESIFEYTFTNKYFHVSLLHFILASLNDLEQMLVDGITEEHFDMVGIAGIDEDNFEAIIEAFDTLLASSVPTTEAGLKALTDAVLITIGVDEDFLDAEQYEYQIDAERAIRGLAENGTALVISWADDDKTVSITVGTYEVVIVFDGEIDFLPFDYIITGTVAAGFTATRVGIPVATSPLSTNQVQFNTFINAIRANVNGADCTIQFGDNDELLNIGAFSVSFNNTTDTPAGTWGSTITLLGRITSSNSADTAGTIVLADNVSIESWGNIANTVANAAGRAINNTGTGAVTINGGTVSANTGQAVHNASTGLITVSGTAEVTSANATAVAGTIVIAASDTTTEPRLIIIGGTVRNTANNSNGRAINNLSTGAVTISGGTVSANTGQAVRNASTGLITVSGTAEVTSANAIADAGTIVIAASDTTTEPRLIIIGGTVSNTATITSGRAINNLSTVAVTISGGTVSATSGQAIRNESTGAVTISGGTVSATSGQAIYNGSTGAVTISGETTVSTTTGNAISNNSSGAITISGGTISVTSGTAVNNSTGAVTISGGTVSANTGTGRAINNSSAGLITVSGTAVVTSANTTATAGTIVIANSGTATEPRLVITGGTVSNTANSENARTINNLSPGVVTISGGTVSAEIAGFVILNANADASLVLNGTPEIAGRIRVAVGRLSVIPATFVPGTNIYLLDFASPAADALAVVDGAAFINNFILLGAAMGLVVNNTNLVMGTVDFAVAGTGNTFTIRRSVGGTHTTIQTAINEVRTAANGADCSVEFVFLNVGTASANFDNTGGTWGTVTLLGSITTTSSTGVIAVGNGVSIESRGSIRNNSTSTGSAGIRKIGTGTVTISGGTVSAALGGTVINAGIGTVIISGGTVSAASGQAVRNDSTGSVIISGGTVSAMLGRAVRNDSTGSVSISGGTISANAGWAVENTSTGLITISGTAVLTSANTTADQGTIAIAASGTATAPRLVITGGTVSNISYNANARAVYNGSTGAVTISGGTVQTISGRAIHNNAAGALTISGGTVQATAADGYGVWNEAAGAVTINNGTVSAVTNGRAVNNNQAAGVVTIYSPPAVILPEGEGTTGTIVWNP
ncbi:MAG: hypothetical protein FWD36_06780, partial [Treponema sp.]|nr:hypothetical protein [Treponema sp.]